VISAPQAKPSTFAGFRLKLLVAMMLVVSAVAAVALIFAQRSAAANAQRQFEREFSDRLASLHAVEDVRNGVLAERCRELALRPRIHAALEDNALDLLYPSARNELVDIMDEPSASAEPRAYALHTRFYRFLNGAGRVIAPPESRGVGNLSAEEEARLSLPRTPDRPETGYLWRQSSPGEPIDELIAMPIVSTETGEIIAAIVLGFRPVDLDSRPAEGIKSGLCVGGRLYLPALASGEKATVAAQVATAAAAHSEGSFAVQAGGALYRLFYKALNPGSLYPPACEVILYPLSPLLAIEQNLLWKYAFAAALLFVGALAASHLLSIRLSRPVEKLAVDSEENLTQRKRAEDALAFTSQELQRSARFSADASHQLKTPVTVLRAGLEELMAGEALSPAGREEISDLIHQTFRLTSIVEDLLLLSRLDAGRLSIAFSPVDLRALIEAGLDDLGTLPEESELKIETELPAALSVAGEKRYTALILQNLLENARKYNQPGGRIRIAAREEGDWVVLTIGNTGRGIPPSAREHIFERFHRGGVGEDLPGHGLGLNLAREMARIHGGELRLSQASESWTEFELRLRRSGASA